MKDGYSLVVVLDHKPRPEMLREAEKVTVLARRDLVRLQKLLRRSSHPLAKKVKKILDNYENYG